MTETVDGRPKQTNAEALLAAAPMPEPWKRLRVVTWNLLYQDLQGPRLDRIAGTLIRLNADIVCAQEVPECSHAELSSRLGGSSFWAPTGTEPPLDSFGCSLWSRYPTVNTREIPLHPQGQRQAAAIEVLTPLGTLLAISAHLTHTRAAGMAAADPPYENDEQISSIESRKSEISFLTGAVAGLRCDHRLLCGDLNLLADSPEYHHLTGSGWSDSWRQRPRLGLRATVVHDNPLLTSSGLPKYLRAHADLPGRADNFDYTLDYQLLRPETLRADRAWTFGGAVDGYPSDHLGVAVDYSLPRTSSTEGRGVI